MGIDPALINSYIPTHAPKECMVDPVTYKHTADEIACIDLTERRFSINYKGETDVTGLQACEVLYKMIMKLTQPSI